MKNLKSIFALIFCLAMTISLFALPLDQPYMKAAKTNLNQAKGNLNKATADKGGHRNKARGLVDQAIEQVNKGIAYDRRNGREDFNADEIFSASAPITADQPFMERAKDNLQQALNNLNKATADKGGHRNKAIDLVKEAIDEVNKGIKYDRNN